MFIMSSFIMQKLWRLFMIRPIDDVVTSHHKPLCKCTICLGSPTYAITVSTALGYACEEHVQQAAEKLCKMMGVCYEN
jgi:hypothetical protein